MFPNQPPPTSTTAAAGTSQTTTQTTAAQPTTTSTVTATLQLAVVTNTANIPATTAASTSTGQQAGAVAGGIGPVRASARVPVRGRGAPYRAIAPAYNLVPNLAPVNPNPAPAAVLSLNAFFSHLFTHTGLQREGSRENEQGKEDAHAGLSGGAEGNENRLSLELSFSEQAIDNCSDPVLKLILQLVNNEQNPARRAAFIIKAARAFESEGVLLRGTLTRLSELLGIQLNSVAVWQRMHSQDTNATSASSTATTSGGATASTMRLQMPMDMFSWTELLAAIQTCLSSPQVTALSQEQTRSGAGAAQSDLTAGLSFTAAFINQQDEKLQTLMGDFNKATNLRDRCTFFARVICVLQDDGRLLHGTYERLSGLLAVQRRGTRNWIRGFQQTRGGQGRALGAAGANVLNLTQTLINAIKMRLQLISHVPIAAVLPVPILTTAAVQPTTASAVLSAPLTFSTLISVPARQTPVFFPATTTAAPPAHSVAQTAAPVFTAPATPSTSAAQLAPVVPPFSPNISETSLEALLDLQPAPVSEPPAPVAPAPAPVAPAPAPSASDPFDLNMAMNEDEMFSLFDE
ncbi:MAG: hypothetical protein ACRC24_02370 [Vibrionaceae bacterium]